MSNDTTGVMWKRLRNFLSPQLDMYAHIANHIPKTAVVLEVGFGTGGGTLQLARTAYRVHACEIDPDAVKFAKHVFPDAAMWFKYDITKRRNMLPHYDAIVCIETLEHIPNYSAALSNIARYLKEDGVAYISGPNANSDLRKTDLHEREFTAAEFRSALDQVFGRVELFDYSLTEPQGDDTTKTPLLAVCRKRNI